LLHNEQHQKLSKRRGHRVAVEDFRDEGFLPEAMRNYLALLGWSPGGNREILTEDEMIAEFRLEDVKSAPAIFDLKKLLSINAEYIRALRVVDFVERSQGWLRDRWDAIAPLVQERVRTLGEVYKMVDFLYLDDPVFDEKDWEKGVRKQPAFAAILDAAAVAYESIDWHTVNIEGATRQVAEQTGVAVRDADRPIRLAVTGRSAGPPLFQSLEALGRERTIARLRTARAKLDGTTG
jgi:glutamyl-tRNA synthetase